MSHLYDGLLSAFLRNFFAISFCFSRFSFADGMVQNYFIMYAVGRIFFCLVSLLSMPFFFTQGVINQNDLKVK